MLVRWDPRDGNLRAYAALMSHSPAAMVAVMPATPMVDPHPLAVTVAVRAAIRCAIGLGEFQGISRQIAQRRRAEGTAVPAVGEPVFRSVTVAEPEAAFELRQTFTVPGRVVVTAANRAPIEIAE